MDLFGRGYVVDHCVAELKKEKLDETFRIYLTDCLRHISENTARMVCGGVYTTIRYCDLVNPPKEDKRTSEEIISGFLDVFGEK